GPAILQPQNGVVSTFIFWTNRRQRLQVKSPSGPLGRGGLRSPLQPEGPRPAEGIRSAGRACHNAPSGYGDASYELAERRVAHWLKRRFTRSPRRRARAAGAGT